MPKNVIAEYENTELSFTEDGWFNATLAAEKFGKQPNEWLRLPATQDYLAALGRRYGKIPYVKTSRARADRGGGTWLHPKLAVAFARWCDIDFAIWCDEHAVSCLILPVQPRGSSLLSCLDLARCLSRLFSTA